MTATEFAREAESRISRAPFRLGLTPCASRSRRSITPAASNYSNRRGGRLPSTVFSSSRRAKKSRDALFAINDRACVITATDVGRRADGTRERVSRTAVLSVLSRHKLYVSIIINDTRRIIGRSANKLRFDQPRVERERERNRKVSRGGS